MKVEQRKVSYANGNGDSHQIYKFEDEKTMQEYLDDFKTYFKRSIQVMHSGKFTLNAQNYLKMIENDVTWHDLKLVPGTPFIITKENSTLKVDEMEKKEKLLKRGVIPQEKPEVKKIRNKPLDVDLLFSGTINEVVEKLNKSGEKHNHKDYTYTIVYNLRYKYKQENPNFVEPEHAKGRCRKQVEYKPKKTLKDLNVSEVKYLMNKPIADVKRILDLTIFQIRALRIEYCKLHPEFVVPRISGFDPTGIVNNKLEDKPQKEKLDRNQFTEEENSIIWDGSGKEVGEILGRSYQAVYFARIDFCKKNPSFVIPAISKFTPPADVSNKIEKVEPVVKQPKNQVITKQPIISKPQSQSQISSELEEILKTFGNLGQKPKAITLSSGIKIEFQ